MTDRVPLLQTTFEPNASGIEKSIHFNKFIQVSASDISSELYPYQINPTVPVFNKLEAFGMFMICDIAAAIYHIEMEASFTDAAGDYATLVGDFPAWTWIPCCGRRFLSPTTATCIMIMGGK